MSVTTSPHPVADLAVAGLEDDGAAWDATVDRSPDGTFCHLSAWREVMTGVLGHECLYRAAVDPDGNVEGVLPLVRVKSRLLGHFLVSVPFLNYGGPVGSPPARRLLGEWAIGEARRSGADLLELRTRHEATPAAGLRRCDHKVAVLLPLPGSADVLWREGFPSKLRTKIRRTQKEGMEFRLGPDQVEAFYEVFSRNMRDLGTPVLPRGLFERLARIFPGRVVFGTVYAGSRPVAAGCGFIWHDEFEMTWASSLREYNRQRPNMLLYWAFMEEMVGRGVRTFNFGRCTPGGGTHQFKQQWGGRDVPLPWSRWSARGVRGTPSPDRPVFRLATSVWQRLPLSLANRIGPPLARRIATF